jgi:hypothetical protein
MRLYEDHAIKTRHVTAILAAIENFHFAFTAIASQRSSDGISLMYALAARGVFQAEKQQAKVKCLQDFKKNKLATKRPPYPEFESSFMELKYSSKMTKQKNLVRYILTKLYQKHSMGLPVDPEQATIEHLAPENPLVNTGLSDEDVASIGNLILVNQTLNGKLGNKSLTEKAQLLKDAKVWVDPVILKAKKWGSAEIERRTRLLAKDAYENVWSV